MPRQRMSQNFPPTLHHPIPQQQQQPLSNSALMALHQHQLQQQQQQPQQYRIDPQVQRSQGVIFLSTNKHQTTAPPPPVPQMTTSVYGSMPTAHQLLQQHHLPAPAHTSSMFQPQNIPGYIPTQIMQNPFLPNYQPVPQQLNYMGSQSNDVYTPNGGTTINYDDFMQAPPQPITPKRTRRSRRRVADSDSSEDSDDFVDNDGDPDWNPNAVSEVPEPIEAPVSPPTRGRRASTTPRGGGRGRGGGGRGRARGRGRGRGGHQESPPTLMDQTAQLNQTSGGRQTRRSSQGLSMPSLDLQHGLSIGQLVSQAVQSLNETDDVGYTHVSGRKGKKQSRSLMAAKLHRQGNYISVEKVPVAPGGISMFVYVDTTVRPQNNAGITSLEEEEEDLIMAYEIMQNDDKQRSFLCESCGHPSKSRVLHNRHLVSHELNLQFACCVCSQLFESHSELKPHLRIHHGSGIFVCPDNECEGVFSERRSLDDHEFACHPDARPFVCRFCFDRFPTIEDSRAHEDGHPEEITAGCMKCSVTFDKKSLLKQHYSDMHEEKQCQFCEEKFENKPALDEHQNEKHAELLKPPTPPPPSPIMDDGPPSPLGGNDDDDDIVVVEEHKRAGKSPAKPGPKRTPAKPEVKKSVKFDDSTSPKKSTPGRPKARPQSKKQPIKSRGTVTGDVIVLSSDEDDKLDPEWKIPEEDRRYANTPSRSNRPVRSVRSKNSKKQSEYVIVVESSTEESTDTKNNSQALTFVVGESGDITHVPTASDPNPPASLPMKQIMDIIKSRNLAENTTIVIEDDQIASIKSTDSPHINKRASSSRTFQPKPTFSINKPSTSNKTFQPSSSINKPSTSRKSSNDIHSKKWVRPPPAEVIVLDDSSPTRPPKPAIPIPKDDSGKSKPTTSTIEKPKSLVARKRTGGISRTEKPTEKNIIEETAAPSPKPAGPIAKKRTGGSNKTYDDMKRSKSESKSEENGPRVKQPRKPIHEVRHELTDPDPLGYDDNEYNDDDDPLIIETVIDTIIPPPKPRPSISLGSSLSNRTPKPLPKMKEKTSKAEKLQEKPYRYKQRPAPEIFAADYDETGSPVKRSLRLAIKASVTESNYDESQQDDVVANESEFVVPTTPAVNRSSSKRGRASNSSHFNSNNSSPSTPVNLNSKRSTPSPASSAAGDGQIIMKAFVNGKWQDVVIGTKLTADESEPIPSTSGDSFMQTAINTVATSSRRNTGGRKKAPVKTGSANRGGRKKGSGRAKGKGRGKKAGVVADSADCWRDDRYQYFSGGQRPLHMSNNISYEGYDDNNSYDQPGYGEADEDAILPFSLSSYMSYQDDAPQPADDQGLPVIVSAYHVQHDDSGGYQQAFQNHDESSQEMQMQDDGDDDLIDEIPIHDPLAMDDAPPPSPPPPEEPSGVESEEEDYEDPLAEPPPRPPPPPVVAPTKGTVVDAKNALSNLRSVLSQITFKR